MAVLMGLDVKHCSSALLDQSQGTDSCSLAPVRCPQPHGPAQVTTGGSSTPPVWITHHGLCAWSSSRQRCHIHRVRRDAVGQILMVALKRVPQLEVELMGHSQLRMAVYRRDSLCCRTAGPQQSSATAAIPHPTALCST